MWSIYQKEMCKCFVDGLKLQIMQFFFVDESDWGI